MWIEDLTKALYYLNSCELKHYNLIQKIEDNVIYFTSGKKTTVDACEKAYDKMVKGIYTDFNSLLYS